MPMISKIGRRSFKTRFLHITILILLVAGGVTMVYPFLLMFAGSTKSAVDKNEMSIIPTFLKDDTALYHKHVEGVFNEILEQLHIAYDSEAISFDEVKPPTQVNEAMVDEWRAFLADTRLPGYTYTCGYIYAPRSQTMCKNLRAYKNHVRNTLSKNIAEANEKLGTEIHDWNSFAVSPAQFQNRTIMPNEQPVIQHYWAFKEDLPISDKTWFSVDGFYKKMYLKSHYTKEIKEYNAAHNTDFEKYSDIRLTRTVPSEPKQAEDWEEFVRMTLNPLWIRADQSAAPLYREFLEAKYGSIETLNRNYDTDHASYADVPLMAEVPFDGLPLADWMAFLSGWKEPVAQEAAGNNAAAKLHKMPVELLRVHSVDFMFRDFLEAKHGSIEKVNTLLGLDGDEAYTSFIDILTPQKQLHYMEFKKRTGALRKEFIVRNYITTVEYMMLHGRGIINTVIYCSLTVILALLVNPLAAYALSRYKLPSAYKILLFLMLTMAFPPMVTQIPVFIMLREFNMLNTFAALILPGIAHGYSIFLLKGFFDSLPQELYESASLDGAGEWTMFWIITMNLSKPVLAVIGLQAFTSAYSNFMFALLICQDESMWTLMVWLYQLTTRSGDGVMYAALLIAAIPTFLIFAFCQNIIMRGIVVPSEK